MKFIKYVCMMLLCGGLCACSSNTAADTKTLTVFAAASLTESLTEIAELYKNENENIDISFNFDSSGTLKTQIEQGATCDIFISAAQKQMNELDINSDNNPDGLDFVKSDTRIDLLQNEVVLIVPEGSDANITSFETLNPSDISHISLGNSDVPVGQYAEQIFVNLGLWDALESSEKITFASNVKEVLSQVESGSVDCGVVYKTNVLATSKVEIVAYAPTDCYEPAIYPASVIKTSENTELAENFLDFLKTDKASEIFEAAGFKALAK